MISKIELRYTEILCDLTKRLEAERAASARVFDRTCQILATANVEMNDAQDELNSRRKFCYNVEQALDGLKGDYVEIIKELRKDAERYRWLRDEAEWYSCHITNTVQFKTSANFLSLDDAIDAAMKEVK